MAKVIGSVLLEIKKYINNKYTKDSFNELVNKSENPETQKLKGAVIIASEFYDFDLMEDVQGLFRKHYGDDEFKNMLYAMADNTLKGVMGLLAKFVSLDRILQDAQKKWNTFYDTGTIEPEKITENEYKITLRDIPQKENFIYGTHFFFERLFQIATKKEVTTTINRKGEGLVEYRILIK